MLLHTLVHTQFTNLVNEVLSIMDTLPVELIHKILSFLPLIDRVRCELVSWKFNNICKDLWLKQFHIAENELPSIKWFMNEYQMIESSVPAELKHNFFRWKLTLKCPRIKQIVVDEKTINSKFFKKQVPHITHLTVRDYNSDFTILNKAISLETFVFEKSACNECEVIQHLPDNVSAIEGPAICNPWIDKWDEFFEHSDFVRFQNLRTLTVGISLQTEHQLNSLLKLKQITCIRFVMGDEIEHIFLMKYMKVHGPKLKKLELFQPDYHPSSRDVYTAINNNCNQLEQLGLKGYFHGTNDYAHFMIFLLGFKSLITIVLNIPRPLTQNDVVIICDNNRNLSQINYTYYMPSMSGLKFKNCVQFCTDVKFYIYDFNRRHPGRRKVTFDTSQVVKNISMNWSQRKS